MVKIGVRIIKIVGHWPGPTGKPAEVNPLVLVLSLVMLLTLCFNFDSYKFS